MEELPNRNCFGINLVIFLCVMVVQKRPFVQNSVSQFLEGLFAILVERSQFCLKSFTRNSRGNPGYGGRKS